MTKSIIVCIALCLSFTSIVGCKPQNEDKKNPTPVELPPSPPPHTGDYTCIEKTDYNPSIQCSSKVFTAKSQTQLNQYLQDYGLDKGKYQSLKISFNVSADDFQIHVPCALYVSEKTNVTATNICFDARRGFNSFSGLHDDHHDDLSRIKDDDDQNDKPKNIFQSTYLSILSSEGNIEFDEKFKVITETLFLRGLGLVKIGQESIFEITKDALIESFGSTSQSAILFKEKSELTAQNLELHSVKEINIGQKVDLAIINMFKATSNGDFINGGIEFDQKSNLTARDAFISSFKKIKLGQKVIFNVSSKSEFFLLGTSSSSEIELLQEASLSSKNLNIDSKSKGTIGTNSTITVFEHFNFTANTCTIKNSATISANTLTGTCYNNLNDLPTLGVDQFFTTGKNTPITFDISTATDLDGDVIHYLSTLGPLHGTISGCLDGSSSRTCTYTPDASFSGIETITYKVNDGLFDSTTTAKIEIQVNAPPVMIGDQTESVNEDTLLSFNLLGATDADADPLTYELITPPTGGILSNCLQNTANLTCQFQPNQDFNGTVSFSYRAFDGGSYSNSMATVTINILPVNDAPIAPSNQNGITNEDTALELALFPGSDVDGDSLTYEIVTLPTHGTVTNCLGNSSDLSCTYTPALNYHGTDSFTYKVFDGTTSSVNVTSVNLTINSINDLPVITSNQTFTTLEDSTISFTLTGATDVDGDALTYTIISAPQSGQLTNCLGGTSSLNCDYIPATNFNGQVSFTYKANDGVADSSNIGTVTINITPVNDAPVMAGNQNVNVDEDSSVDFTLSGASDVENDVLTYQIISAPTNGTLTNCLQGTSDLTCTFTPSANFNGTISFTYQAFDGNLNSASVSTVSITIIPINDAPIMLANQNFETDEDVPLEIILNGAIDLDGDSLIYKIVQTPNNGTLVNCLSNGPDLSCTFIPEANFNGTVNFSYIANDGTTDAQAPALISITVKPINDAPVLGENQSISQDEDSALNFTLNTASDVDGDSITYSLVGQAPIGTLSGCLDNSTSLSCTYTPPENYFGTVTLQYKANDGTTDSANTGTITFLVNSVNDAPIMIGDQAETTNEDTSISFTLRGATDVENDSLTFSLVTSPSNGTLSGCLGGTSSLDCTFTPYADFNGDISFSYKANDSQSDSQNPAIVTIHVTPVNDSPLMGIDQQFTINENEALNFNANPANDVDGDALTYKVIVPPNSGTLTGCMDNTSDLSCTFTPETNFSGEVIIRYRAKDALVSTQKLATITITVLSTNQAPVMAASQTLEVNEDQLLNFNVLAATDSNGDSLKYKIVKNVSSGTLNACLDDNDVLTCSYQPAENFYGEVRFEYIANDGRLDANTPTEIILKILPQNDTPIPGQSISMTTNENEEIQFQLPEGIDVDNDILSFSLVSGPTNGTITDCLNSTDNRLCRYTPNSNFRGDETIQYAVSDASISSLLLGEIKIHVNEVPHAPILTSTQSFIGSEDQVLSFTLAPATDANGDPLTYWLKSTPSNGELKNCLNGDSDLTCEFTPNLNFNGEVTFSYVAFDGKLNSNLSTVTLKISPTQDAPILGANQEFNLDEDSDFNFSINPALDPDGDALLFYTLVTPPSSGTLSGCLENTDLLSCKFTPAKDFNGEVSFTYMVSDGTHSSLEVATVRLNVTPINDAPVFAIETFLAEGSPGKTNTIILPSAIDVDSISLTYSIMDAPNAGTLSNCLDNSTDLECDLTIPSDFSGDITFSYLASDGESESLPLNVKVSVVSIGSKVAFIKSGIYQTCAVLTNGDLYCWGLNNIGQLGYGIGQNIGDNELPKDVGPVQVGDRVAKVAIGITHTCVLLVSGDVKCWGNNSVGQLGYGNTTSITDPSTAGIVSIGAKVLDIEANGSVTCVLLENKTLKCWGSNYSGVLGLPSVTNIGRETVPSDFNSIELGDTVEQFDLSEDHICALLTSGGVKCWGYGGNGSLGYGNSNNIGQTDSPSDHSIVPIGSSVIKIAVGENHSCAILSNNKLKCWGRNGYKRSSCGYFSCSTITTYYGQLGLQKVFDVGLTNTPDQVEPITLNEDIVDISLGDAFTCATTATSKIICFGINIDGQLSLGSSTQLYGGYNPVSSIKPISIGSPISQLSSGRAHSCLLSSEGEMKCWGSNTYGQLGQGNVYNIGSFSLPTDHEAIPIGMNVKSIVAGYQGPCALNEFGEARCWGYATTGELGLATLGAVNIGDNETPSSIPKINSGGVITQISKGWSHTCALFDNLKAKCWGRAYSGELGYGNKTTIGDDESPADVGFINPNEDFIDVSAGSSFTCAVNTFGQVKCWGDNGSGQLGQGNTISLGDDETIDQISPISLSSSAKKVYTGTNMACAILDTDDVQCWGKNTVGQLGYGNTLSIGATNVPSVAGVVSLNGKVSKLALGSQHVCALMKDKTVRCWGASVAGALGAALVGNIGDNELPSSIPPVAIGEEAIDIAVGDQHSCALLLSGNVRCWGNFQFIGIPNLSQNIGDNETPEFSENVFLGAKAKSISADHFYTCAQLENETVKCWGFDQFSSFGLGIPAVQYIGRGYSLKSAPFVSLSGASSTAQFTYTKDSDYAPSVVTFDASSSTPSQSGATLVSFKWEFGDGSIASGATLRHTYTSGKSYNVRLIVTDSLGNSGIARETITILPEPKPTAKIASDTDRGPAFLTVNFDGTTSTASLFASSIIDYKWDFGDGEFGIGARPQHIYKQKGIFVAKLTVTDDLGKTSFVTKAITALDFLPPTSVINVQVPDNNYAPTSVRFDGVASFPNSSGTSIQNYEWSFGDGESATGILVNHTYTKSGSFKVTLTTTDSNQKSSSTSAFVVIRSEAMPVASIIPSVQTGLRPLLVSFDASASAPSPLGTTISNYSWSFGDGQTGTGQTINHNFTNQGEYNIELTVLDDAGKSAKTSITIDVTPANPPIINSSITEDSIYPNVPVTITANAIGTTTDSGTITSYLWNFGDGTSASGISATHTYATPGEFKISLKVTNSDNEFSTKEFVKTYFDSLSINILAENEVLLNNTSTKLKAIVRDHEGSIVNYPVGWTSTNQSVLTVNNFNEAVSHNSGEAFISAKVGNSKSSELNIKVVTSTNNPTVFIPEDYFLKTFEEVFSGIVSGHNYGYVSSTSSPIEKSPIDFQGNFKLTLSPLPGLHDENIVATDYSNGSNTTIVPIRFFEGLGNSLLYDGIDDTCLLSFNEGDISGDELTIAFWARPAMLIQDTDVFSLFDQNNHGLSLKLDFTGAPIIEADTDFQKSIIIGNPIDLNNWTHLAIVINKTNKKIELFQNGRIVATKVLHWSISWNEFNLNGQFGSPEFSGILDEFYTFKKALNENEVKDLMFDSNILSIAPSIGFNFEGVAKQIYLSGTQNKSSLTIGRIPFYGIDDPKVRTASEIIAQKTVNSTHGGVLSSRSGNGPSSALKKAYTLEVPPLALDKDYLMTLESLDPQTPGYLPSGIQNGGEFLRIFPLTGIELKTSATLTVPIERKAYLKDKVINLYSYSKTSGTISRLPIVNIDTTDQKASFLINKMGTYFTSYDSEIIPQIIYNGANISDSGFYTPIYDRVLNANYKFTGPGPFDFTITGSLDGALLKNGFCYQSVISSDSQSFSLSFNDFPIGERRCLLEFTKKIDDKTNLALKHLLIIKAEN